MIRVDFLHLWLSSPIAGSGERAVVKLSAVGGFKVLRSIVRFLARTFHLFSSNEGVFLQVYRGSRAGDSRHVIVPTLPNCFY